jgi:hypothetical protein
VASLSQGRTAAAQCGLFTHKSVPVVFVPSCIINSSRFYFQVKINVCSFSEGKLVSGVNFVVKWMVQISLLSLSFLHRERSEPVTMQPTL